MAVGPVVPIPAAEARIRSLIDHLGAIVWEAVPGDGRAPATITFMSDGTLPLLGHPPARFVAEPGFWLDVVHPEDRDRVREVMRGAVDARAGADLEYRCVGAAGQEVWVRTILRVQEGADDEVRLHGVAVDVTERHAADARLQRIQDLSDALAGLLDAREIARVVASQGRRAVGAAAVAVFLRVGADQLEISGYDGFADAAVEEVCRLPLAADVPAAEAVRTGRALVLPAGELAARYPGAAGWRRLAGDGPFVALPLRLQGRPLGALALRMPPGRAVGRSDRLMLEVLGRACAQALARAATVEAERAAAGRLQRQYAVAAALAQALTPGDVAAAVLADLVDAVGADHGTVWQLTEDGNAVRVIGMRGFTEEEMAGHRRVALRESRPVVEAVRSGRPVCYDTAAEADAAYPVFEGVFGRRGLESLLALPLPAGGRPVGGLLLLAGRRAAFGEDERALATALAAQAGQALERARLFEAERDVADTLQRSLLPSELPEVAGVELAVRYVPAAGLQAGGDFYEALPLPDGAIALAVGDVVGRGARAAAAMGQLRSALRAFALVGEGPAATLERLSAFAATVGGAMAATAVVARLEPATGALRYACAGHPWPLVIHAGGDGGYLRDGRGLPLAVEPEPGYVEATAVLRPGSTLLLYTDGLTERRGGGDVQDALGRLHAAAAVAVRRPLPELLDAAVRATGDAPPADDVALVAVRLR